MTAKTKSHKTDLVIAGGGVAGLALAALLGRQTLNVHVIDPAPPQPVAKTAVTSRTVALMESSLNIMRAAGLDETIRRHGNPLKIMRIIDDSMPNREAINAPFKAGDIGLNQFGFNVPNTILRAALYEAVQKIPSVTLHMPGKLASFVVEDNRVVTSLENGGRIESPLMIGADGQNSRVRTLAGIECKVKDYDQAAITCLISHTRSHHDTATEFHRAPGPLALVPLPGNQSSVVWVEQKDRAAEFMALRRDQFLQALQERSNDILGTLTLDSNPESWPLRTMQAKALIAPRVALAAEAAHVMSPITAQGLNLSLRDIGALAETIMDAIRAGLDIGSGVVLEKYRRRRLTDINTRVFGVDGMNSIVSTDFGFLKGLRRSGLKTVETIPPLKKFAMHHGLAPDIDHGRLAKGLPL